MAEQLEQWLQNKYRQPGVWDVLTDLSSMKEGEIVNLLRPHEERNVPPTLQMTRSRLDDALDLLTLGEIAAQLCGPDHENDFLGVPLSVWNHLESLVRSQAFRHYLEVYQYAGVRFLIARERRLRGAAMAPVKRIVAIGSEEGAVVNCTSLPLSTPPSLNLPGPEALELMQQIATTPAAGSDERAALNFLEGFDIHGFEERRSAPTERSDDHQESRMELWLRGLLPELGRRQTDGSMPGTVLSTYTDMEEGRTFEQIARGIMSWGGGRAGIYWKVREIAPDEFPLPMELAQGQPRPKGGWNCDTPRAARLALADLYFLSKLLRAEISPQGDVVYGPVSWLGLIGLRAAQEGDTGTLNEVRALETVLRSVFGLVCELFRNAAELQARLDDRNTDGENAHGRKNDKAVSWRAAFDEELEAIQRQRLLRDYDTPLPADHEEQYDPKNPAKDWSRSVLEEGTPRELVGLCFSGGGIRSATFNLGVLEGLQELDMLRPVDYLSTVSGGGFIGGWLVGNVRRSQYWLGSRTPWAESIKHLRQYSNYLAPNTGILSMDTWSLGGLWLRNTVLIQLLVLVWVLAGFSVLHVLRGVFALIEADAAPKSGAWTTEYWVLLIIALFCEFFVAGFIAVNLCARSEDRWNWLRDRIRTCAIMTWLGCSLLSIRVLSEARQWSMSYVSNGEMTSPKFGETWISKSNFSDYSKLLQLGYGVWRPVLVCTGIALFLLTWLSLQKSDSEWRLATGKHRSLLTRIGLAAFASVFCTLILHLLMTAMAYIALTPSQIFHSAARGDLLGFVFGPAAMVASYSLVVLLLVGLIAKRSNESQREWWTRFGAWILVAALLGMAASGIMVGAPKLFEFLGDSTHYQKIKWSAIISWVGTMVGGLFAGKSSKTSDQTKDRSLPLDLLAKLGGFLFLIAFMAGSSFLLYLLIRACNSFSAPTISETISRTPILLPAIMAGIACTLGYIFSWRFEINLFGLNQLYRNRLVRCYLGATRWVPGMRHPEPFTKFDFKDDIPLTDLRKDSQKYAEEFRGPFPILNCSLNMGGSRDLNLHTRHSASFTFTPLHCGADRPAVGYMDTREYAGGDVGLGMAVAISGAAASPNMGYNTSPLVAFLLSMFNVRLGWWIPNPGQSKYDKRYLSSSIAYMGRDLLGIASDGDACLNISDGGHFENMGLYEMVRRRCKLILLGDGECDEVMQFGGLANAIRLCATDFGARIEIDLSSLQLQEDGRSLQHAAIGTIQYANGSIGRLIYLKASITGDEDATVKQYQASHPSFPHQSTAEQFFTEDQFESYRRLGKHVVRQAFRGTSAGEHPVAAAERMADMLAAQGCDVASFTRESAQLDVLWERLRCLGASSVFLEELMGLPHKPDPTVTTDIVAIGLEVFQFMENVYMNLRLDDFWEHPDNRGWAMLFMNWARSTRLRQVWRDNHRTFGIRFEYFCARRLGLSKDKPLLRVTPLPRN